MDERLPVLTLEEAQDVIDVLAYLAHADDGEWGAEARHLLGELAARVPSREDP